MEGVAPATPDDDYCRKKNERYRVLKVISCVIVGIIYPVFIVSTIIGTMWFVENNRDTPECTPDPKHRWFMILWLVVCYTWIITYAALIFIWSFSTINLTRVRSHMLQLLRRMDHFDDELFENARNHLNEENVKRLDIIKTLHEYGIYFTRRGLTSEEIARLPMLRITKSDILKGQIRCNICLKDFGYGEQVRLISTCAHMFHFKCLEMWLQIESACPNCCNGQTRSQAANSEDMNSIMLRAIRPRDNEIANQEPLLN